MWFVAAKEAMGENDANIEILVSPTHQVQVWIYAY